MADNKKKSGIKYSEPASYFPQEVAKMFETTSKNSKKPVKKNK
ncbi:hypothetical protein [Ruminococcus champanellensis]|jgi:hypothetical protein|nr:MAG TPA: hypothetical protein [Caudoviricetes sp.]DAZ78311.1 MAG TPA: hypothetical protein [Caudoviricetes sp.]